MKVEEKKFSWGTALFYVLFVVVSFVLVRHFADIQRAALYIEDLNPLWLLVALLAQTTTYFCIANLLSVLLDFYEHRQIGRWELFRSAIVIVFLDQAIPTGGMSGNGFIYSRLRRSGLPAGQAFSVLVLKTITYYSSHLLILLVGLMVCLPILWRNSLTLIPTISILGILLYLFLIGIVIIFGEPKSLFHLRKRLIKFKLGGLLEKLGLAPDHDQDNLATVWHGPARFLRENSPLFLKVLAWQVGVILADVVTCYALYAGLGRAVPFSIVMVCFALTMVVSFLSVTPGALAFFEGAMILFYTSFGINFHLAVVVTFLFRGLSFWLPMPIGLALYRQLTKRSRVLKEV